MRGSFRSYYPLNADERARLWREGTVIFDTNALLDLYRYDLEAREAFMRVLETQPSRIWIPYQVGLEFQRNRLGMVGNIRRAFDKMRKAADASRATLGSSIDELKRHPTIDSDILRSIVEEMHQKITHHLDLASSAGSKLLPKSDLEDAIWNRVSTALEGRVGEPPSAEELEEWHAEAQRRIDAEEPPGYKDRDKDAPESYGDYLIWRQILNFAQPDGSVIFVTGDRKEDWWRKHEGRHLGARIELLDEFHATTTGVIAFYTPDEFLRHARDEFEVGEVPERVLSLVEEVGRIEEESARRKLIEDLQAMERQIASAAATIAEIDAHLEKRGLPRDRSARQSVDHFVSVRRSLDERMGAALQRMREIERRMDLTDPAEATFNSLIEERQTVGFEIDYLGGELEDLHSTLDAGMRAEDVDEYRRLMRSRDMQWNRLREAETKRMGLRTRLAEADHWSSKPDSAGGRSI